MKALQIEGIRFLKYLQDRMNKPQTRALLSTLANRLPGRGGAAGSGQRDAGRRDHGGSLHRPVLQGAAVGRLFSQPESGRL